MIRSLETAIESATLCAKPVALSLISSERFTTEASCIDSNAEAEF